MLSLSHGNNDQNFGDVVVVLLLLLLLPPTTTETGVIHSNKNQLLSTLHSTGVVRCDGSLVIGIYFPTYIHT